MLKGKSVIELTNVKTGEVERYENPNIITDGVQKYINALFRFGGHSTSTVMWKEIFGGIRLYDNNLEAVASNYLHPSVDVAKLTGYASITQKPSSTTDTMRGNLNTDETKALENGVQIVYDFATSEANGQIGCCCLTTDFGGQCGFYGGGSHVIYSDYDFGIDSKTGEIEFPQRSDNSHSIRKYDDYMGLKSKSIIPRWLRTFEATAYRYAYYIYGENALYLSTADGKTTFYIRNRETNELVKTIATNENLSNIKGMDAEYIIGYTADGKQIFVQEIANASNLRKKAFEWQTDYSSPTSVNDFWGRMANGDFVVNNVQFSPKSLQGQKIVSIFSAYNSNYYYSDYVDFDWLSFRRSTRTSSGFYAGKNENMLFTINNLETPVTKTADKTMKITYTLLESDEV